MTIHHTPRTRNKSDAPPIGVETRCPLCAAHIDAVPGLRTRHERPADCTRAAAARPPQQCECQHRYCDAEHEVGRLLRCLRQHDLRLVGGVWLCPACRQSREV